MCLSEYVPDLRSCF